MTFNKKSQRGVLCVRAIFLALIMFATNVGNAIEPLSQLCPEYKITIDEKGTITTVTPSGRVIKDSFDGYTVYNTSNKLSPKNYYQSREEVPTEEEFLKTKEKAKEISDRESSNTAAAKNGLSPSQIATINQLQDEVSYTYKTFNSKKDKNYENFPNPILVGDNIVFHKNWLDYTYGPNRMMDPEHLVQLRNNLDKFYNCCKDFLGDTPKKGDKILIDILPQTGTAGYSFGYRNVVYISGRHFEMQFFWPEVRAGSWSLTLMHEIAHTFSYYRGYNIDDDGSESIVELMISYALENNREANYGVPGAPTFFGFTKGEGHRMRLCEKAFGQFQKGTIEWNSDNPYEGGAFDFYLQGLVGNISWEPYEKAFQSYNDDSFRPRYTYSGKREGTAILALLERIAHFSPDPVRVLQSLPDRGQLFKMLKTKYGAKGTPPTAPKQLLTRSLTQEEKIAIDATITPEEREAVITSIAQKLKDDELRGNDGTPTR